MNASPGLLDLMRRYCRSDSQAIIAADAVETSYLAPLRGANRACMDEIHCLRQQVESLKAELVELQRQFQGTR